MDEPLSNLDAKLRVQMRAEVAELQARLAVTTVYVTHDQTEAMTLGHRVAVLTTGAAASAATPARLYDRPVNTFVAGFIGSPAMNLCDVQLGSNGSSRSAAPRSRSTRRCRERRDGSDGTGSSSACGQRRWSSETPGLPARVEVVEELGADAYVSARRGLGDESVGLVARTKARRSPGLAESGSRCALARTRRTSQRGNRPQRLEAS